jgi:hypothetical protein
MEGYLDYEKANEPYFTTFTTITTAAQDALTTKEVPNPAPPPDTITVPNGDIVVQSTNGFTLGQAIRLVPTGHAVQDVIVNSIDAVNSTITVEPALSNPMTAGDAIQGTQPRRRSYGEAAFDDHGVVNSWGFATLGAGGVQQRQVGDSGLYQNGRVEVLTSSITGTLNIAIETSIDGSAWNSIGTLGPIAAPGVLSTTINNFDNLIRLKATMSGGAGDSATFKSVLYMKKG